MLKTFAFLATIYGPHGADVYVLDHDMTGADCVARIETGLTLEDVDAMKRDQHKLQAAINTARLSCELQ